MRQFLLDTFSDLSKDQQLLEELVAAATVRKISKHEVMIDYGSYIHFVPLVVQGTIKVVRENREGREILLYFLTDGSTCAASFSCCLIRKRSEIRAVAETDATILAIPLASADDWLSRYKVWRDFIMSSYDERLYALIDLVDKLAFANLDENLWDYLQDRASLDPHADYISASHQEIALDLNVSREAVSRLLKKLENRGKVELGRNRIRLLDV
ncbi:MAG: Crp/Fnr family transcriptional regulator [Saprospiraceae bacterium]|nr:Crp/Fnr family transcriptional regulator [Saprospiraceae bacterium]